MQDRTAYFTARNNNNNNYNERISGSIKNTNLFLASIYLIASYRPACEHFAVVRPEPFLDFHDSSLFHIVTHITGLQQLQ
jgi:hypothetical protein